MLSAATLTLAQEASTWRRTSAALEDIARRWNSHLENVGMVGDLTAGNVALMLAALEGHKADRRFSDDVKPSAREIGPAQPKIDRSASPWWKNSSTSEPCHVVSFTARSGEAPVEVLMRDAATRAAVERTCRKWGFCLGDTVNLKIAPYGQQPGEVFGFTGTTVWVKWYFPSGRTTTGSVPPEELRAGP